MVQKSLQPPSYQLRRLIYVPPSSEATCPVSLSCPLLIPTFGSLSRGDPNGMNCVSLLFRKSRFVVSSKRFVIWSKVSRVPYFECLSFSVNEVNRRWV